MKEKQIGKILGGWILLSVLFLICLLVALRLYQREVSRDREEMINLIYQQDSEVARIVLNETMAGKTAEKKDSGSAVTDLGYTKEGFYRQGKQDMLVLRVLLLCIVLAFLMGGVLYFWHWQKYWYQRSKELAKGWQQEQKKVSNYKMRWNNQKRLRENMKVFTENIAHQLKTPLTRITLALDMMEAEDMCEKRDMCLKELEEVRSLVEEVLNLARMESGKVPLHSRPIEFIPMLEDAIEKTGKKDSYQWEFSGSKNRELLYYGDEVWLLQAFFNLYDNAARYTPEGGVICTEVHSDNQGIQLEIRDSGGGIPEEALEALFERFYCANSQDMTRTGIGLNLAREVIQKHHGRMQVHNMEGGAVFSVWLPVYSLKSSM
ncbi:MAG: HAMP domain-containing histidine kinase [Lachnospiraceae bacterium]|nr:HAMP domain-containing histidine kinase [Lachnospiraceae bacterium]